MNLRDAEFREIEVLPLFPNERPATIIEAIAGPSVRLRIEYDPVTPRIVRHTDNLWRVRRTQFEDIDDSDPAFPMGIQVLRLQIHFDELGPYDHAGQVTDEDLATAAVSPRHERTLMLKIAGEALAQWAEPEIHDEVSLARCVA